MSIAQHEVRPYILQLEVTNDCNLDCDICMRKTSKRRIGYLDFEDFRKLPLKDFKEIAFHGWGEPFLHPELFEMIDHANSLGIRTSLITNGTLLEERMEELLESGIDSIAVGIFAIDGKKKVLEAMEKLSRELSRKGLEIETWMDITITRYNLEDIPRLVEFAGRNGFNVNLHRLFALHNPRIEKPSIIEEVRACISARKAGKGYGIRIHCPDPRSRPCKVALTTIFISWDCRASPCCFLCEMGYQYGDALNLDFDRILESHWKFMEEMKRNETCRKCPW